VPHLKHQQAGLREIIVDGWCLDSQPLERNMDSLKSVESDSTCSQSWRTPASPCVETTGSEEARAGWLVEEAT
jgi:hypothetical protein